MLVNSPKRNLQQLEIGKKLRRNQKRRKLSRKSRVMPMLKKSHPEVAMRSKKKNDLTEAYSIAVYKQLIRRSI